MKKKTKPVTRAGRTRVSPRPRATAPTAKLIRDVALFLRHLCERSDKAWNGHRTKETERDYQRAKALIARAESL